jgi:general secretion pathway protein F
MRAVRAGTGVANYQYKAATPGGEVVEGVLAGETRAEVVRRLQANGQLPIRVEEARTRAPPRRLWRRRRRVTQEEIADVTRELGTLLRAGLPLDRALSILISLAGDRPLGRLLSGVRQRVKDGATLAGAMEAQGPVFSPFYISLVRAAEAGARAIACASTGNAAVSLAACAAMASLPAYIFMSRRIPEGTRRT